MTSGFRIGRLFGININVDWSWLFIFFLVTWNLGVAFSQVHPEWGFGLTWGIAILASLLFFASVLAHELAHSLVAISQGLPVNNITLFLFGGVSNIQREPPSPGKEALITVVGPLTSIIIGVICTVLGTTLAGMQISGVTDPGAIMAQLSPLTTILLWLGPINLILGFFNLLPAFPVDGGRLLRALLWASTNNLREATRWAAWVSQVIAWIMIITGIAVIFGLRFPIFGTTVISGIWLAFIGWFLSNSAQQSYRSIVVQSALEGVPVTRLMRSDVPAVSPSTLVSTLVYDYVMKTENRAFPVVENDQPVGIVSIDDVRKIPKDTWDTTTVDKIMTPARQLATVNVQDDASDALNKLNARDVHQIPVMQNGHIVGMVRRQDILRWLQMQSGAPAH